jgi:hypothetical protein
MRRKAISMNLRVMMILVMVIIVVFLLFQVADNNVSFISGYGNKSINGSVSGVFN